MAEFSNPLALLIFDDPVNAVRLTLAASLRRARFNFAEPRAELIFVDHGHLESIRFHGFNVPRTIAGSRQCDENGSCCGHGDHCCVVEDILKHAQLVRAARTRISPHLCARSERGGFLKRQDAGKNYGAGSLHTTHKPRNLLPVPLCPPQTDHMIEAFPQPSVKQLHEVFPYCVACLAHDPCRQIAWRDAVDAKA